MPATAVVLFEVTLADPAADEDAFLAWWAEAEALLRARARMERASLVVLARGAYLGTVELAFTGSWKLVSADRPWRALEARRPRAEVRVREGRLWRREGVRDVTTSTLARWLDERAAGTRDFVLLDVLSAKSFAESHIAGAVSLPVDTIDAASAAATIGAQKDRAVVVHCAHYG